MSEERLMPKDASEIRGLEDLIGTSWYRQTVDDHKELGLRIPNGTNVVYECAETGAILITAQRGKHAKTSLKCSLNDGALRYAIAAYRAEREATIRQLDPDTYELILDTPVEMLISQMKGQRPFPGEDGRPPYWLIDNNGKLEGLPFAYFDPRKN